MSETPGERMVIRIEETGERATVDEIVRQAFGREVEADLVRAIRASPGWIPQLSLVAEREGELVGHVLFSRVAIESEGGEQPALVLAPVAVLPAAQNQGVGSALVREGLDRARALGERLVVLLGHPNYYPRFGFQPA
ncbi:MAG TPA: N-acetyltransferase, partial [Thermomicrobiaceae bacterium]|nr:N-acetyltransferase [Thermomicrobiaceae bacterium]